MDDPNAWRIALAADIATAYVGRPGVRSVVVGGSAVRGEADAYSDIDMIVYWDRVDGAWLETPQLTATNVRRFTFMHLVQVDPRLYLEQYFVGDVKVDVGHLALDWCEEEISAVVDRLDAMPDRRELLQGLSEAVVLHGPDVVERLRARAAFPDALADRLVADHLMFMPPWVLTKHGIERDDLFGYYETLRTALTNLVAVLSAVNRTYVCTAKLKRVEAIVSRFRLAPAAAGDRVHALLERRDVDENYRALVEEALALVEREMPHIDTATARSLFAFAMPPAVTPQRIER